MLNFWATAATWAMTAIKASAGQGGQRRSGPVRSLMRKTDLVGVDLQVRACEAKAGQWFGGCDARRVAPCGCRCLLHLKEGRMQELVRELFEGGCDGMTGTAP
jgi:hypothetical protein